MSSKSLFGPLFFLVQRPFKYAGLFREILSRDLSSRYKGAKFGKLWTLITPLAMLAVYTFVFSEVFQARWDIGNDDKLGFAINLFAGITVHALFAECASRATGVIAQHGSYVKRVVFPLWLLTPMVGCSALFHALMSFAILLLAFVLFYGFLHPQVLWLPVLLLPLLLLLLGLVWLISALAVYLRDLAQVVPVVITAMLFLSPIFYPVSALPERFQPWLYLNPLTPAIEQIRALLVQGVMVDWASYGRYLLLCSAIAVVGLLFFQRVKKGFSDVL